MPYPSVIPAGSQPPPMDDTELALQAQNTDGQGASGQPANALPAEGSAGSPSDSKLLGKFNSPEELARAYQELEGAHGRQSSEIGDLRKTNNVLLTQLEQGQKKGDKDGGQSAASAPPDYDAQLAAITAQVEDGELAMGEAILLSSRITAEKVLAQAEENFANREKNSKIKSVQEQFMKDHPDYVQMRDAGILDQAMEQNPLHDRFSAYFALKAQEAAANAEQAAADAYNRGKTEVQKLAEGTKVAEKVLAGPGSTVRQGNAPTGPLSNNDIRASMQATLDKVRGGG
jgi:hypothetical protein